MGGGGGGGCGASGAGAPRVSSYATAAAGPGEYTSPPPPYMTGEVGEEVRDLLKAPEDSRWLWEGVALRRRRVRKKRRPPTRRRKTTPPITPPAMAPTGVFLPPVVVGLAVLVKELERLVSGLEVSVYIEVGGHPVLAGRQYIVLLVRRNPSLSSRCANTTVGRNHGPQIAAATILFAATVLGACEDLTLSENRRLLLQRSRPTPKTKARATKFPIIGATVDKAISAASKIRVT